MGREVNYEYVIRKAMFPSQVEAYVNGGRIIYVLLVFDTADGKVEVREASSDIDRILRAVNFIRGRYEVKARIVYGEDPR